MPRPTPLPRDARPKLDRIHAATTANRVRSARRIVRRWTDTYPPLPADVRRELADALLSEDDTDCPTAAGQ